MSFSQNLGHFSHLGPVTIAPKPFIHSTVNTWVTCPICKGGGFNVIPHHNGQVDMIFCPHCKGRKKYFNSVN